METEPKGKLQTASLLGAAIAVVGTLTPWYQVDGSFESILTTPLEVLWSGDAKAASLLGDVADAASSVPFLTIGAVLLAAAAGVALFALVPRLQRTLHLLRPLALVLVVLPVWFLGRLEIETFERVAATGDISLFAGAPVTAVGGIIAFLGRGWRQLALLALGMVLGAALVVLFLVHVESI